MTKYREPSSIVEMAEMCRKAQGALMAEHVKSTYVRDMARIISVRLQDCDYYEIDDGIGKATDLMFNQLFAGKELHNTTIDKDSRLPSKTCAFWQRGTTLQFPNEDPAPFMYFAVEEHDGIYVYGVSPYFSTVFFGGYQVEVEGAILLEEGQNEEDKTLNVCNILTVAVMCSILNQPSFTKREPAGSRQERRAAQRSGTYATDAWHKVTWNIGEEVKAKLTRDEPVRCMPLHYTRGHWRKGEEGWINTTQRKDGLWYQWIEGFWSGHPAFGIKKSYHAPKIGKSTF
jgi:hypothetical protein